MINFHYETDFALDTEEQSVKWISGVIKSEGFKEGDINFIFCNDDYLHGLNVEFLGHYGTQLSNQYVQSSYYAQYNHPNYGFTNARTASTSQYANAFGSGLTTGSHYLSVSYYRRADNNVILQTRTYVSCTLQSVGSGNANFLGSGDPAKMAGGCQYGSGGNYSNTSSQSWPNSMAGYTYTGGGGQVTWGFTGCCYNYYATGFADRRR